MKKEYITPQMEAIEIQQQSQLLNQSIRNIDGNGPGYGGAGNGNARAPKFDSWNGSDEEDEEDW